MANEYASLEELQQAATVNDTDDNVLMEVALEAASRAIDERCHRRFWLDAVASARYFTALRSDVVLVDDIGDATDLAVAVDQSRNGTWSETWTVNADFYLAPRNAASDGKPWTQLHWPSWGVKRWPCGADAVRVTARWGWPAVPAPIKQATLIQASRLLKRKDTPLGVSGGATDLRLLARLDPDVEVLVAPYAFALCA